MVSPDLDQARARLEKGRAEIFERHRAGAGGQEVVRAISALTDEVVSELFKSISGEGDPPLSLVATGGYGRNEMAPREELRQLIDFIEGSERGIIRRSG